MSRRLVRSLHKDKKLNRKGQETDTDIDVWIFILISEENFISFFFILAQRKKNYTNLYGKNGQKFNWNTLVLQ